MKSSLCHFKEITLPCNDRLITILSTNNPQSKFKALITAGQYNSLTAEIVFTSTKCVFLQWH